MLQVGVPQPIDRMEASNFYKPDDDEDTVAGALYNVLFNGDEFEYGGTRYFTRDSPIAFRALVDGTFAFNLRLGVKRTEAGETAVGVVEVALNVIPADGGAEYIPARRKTRFNAGAGDSANGVVIPLYSCVSLNTGDAVYFTARAGITGDDGTRCTYLEASTQLSICLVN